MGSPAPLNSERLLNNFLAMLRVDSFHGSEDRLVERLRPMLAPAGVTFRQDAVGNLIGSWPGRNSDCRPIMLNAHMDTVQPTPGMEPRVTADGVYSDGSSVLGRG